MEDALCPCGWIAQNPKPQEEKLEAYLPFEGGAAITLNYRITFLYIQYVCTLLNKNLWSVVKKMSIKHINKVFINTTNVIQFILIKCGCLYYNLNSFWNKVLNYTLLSILLTSIHCNTDCKGLNPLHFIHTRNIRVYMLWVNCEQLL